MINYGLIGVGGYIAVRHLKAIKETCGNLMISMDINDSVGIIDQYFPRSLFFMDSENFLNKIREFNKSGQDNKINFISVCSPNHLHFIHTKWALVNDCNAICEKPVVHDIKDIDNLRRLEENTGRKVFTILQLRRHQKLIEFHEQFKKEKKDKKKDVVLTYITGRGNWYYSSWKGDPAKSGGIATNIGIHLFDLLIWFFGRVQNSELHLNCENKMSGFLELENAYVRWFLSIDFDDIPERLKGIKNTYRAIFIDNEELEFSEGFTELHTIVYKDILEGKGIGIEEAMPSIELVCRTRNKASIINEDTLHPETRRILKI